MDTYKNYSAIIAAISEKTKSLRADMPDVMQGFDMLAKSASKAGALDEKTKEFIALAIGIATRCDGCIGFHAKALARMGATRQEIEEVLAMAVYMGGGPSLMYAADALRAYEQFSSPT
jgi:AhpD family alkylhydroperoxidase